MTWREWKEQAKSDPRTSLEADLAIGTAGIVIAFIGGSATFAGFCNSGGCTATEPLWGTVLFVVGILAVLLGIVLAVLNVGFFLAGRRRR